MHAKDLAVVIKEMIEKDKYINMNVATEENYTVDKIAKIALKACDADNLEIHYDKNKPNGQMRKDIDISLFKKMFPTLKLKKLSEGISEIYQKRSKK